MKLQRSFEGCKTVHDAAKTVPSPIAAPSLTHISTPDGMCHPVSIFTCFRSRTRVYEVVRGRSEPQNSACWREKCVSSHRLTITYTITSNEHVQSFRRSARARERTWTPISSPIPFLFPLRLLHTHPTLPTIASLLLLGPFPSCNSDTTTNTTKPDRQPRAQHGQI
jgi:hypothetical protein